jgi:hypothetical protein
MSDRLREDYFLKFDIRSTCVITKDAGPYLFTLEVLKEHGVQDQHELYDPGE